MSFYDHFRTEERPFVERVLEMAERVKERYQPRLTQFLDPREQFIVQSIVGRLADVTVSFSGGYGQAERRRALIFTEFYEVSPVDFQVTLLSIERDINVSHRDILGSLLGIGLKREKFGDILVTPGAKQIIICSDVAGYVLGQLQQISRYNITLQTTSLDQIQVPDEPWVFKETTVSSLRLDVILSDILSLSRSKVTSLIKSGRVKVNWRVTDQGSIQLGEGDILSVKGFGRFLFSSIEGRTKKDKIRVRVGRKEDKR